MNSQYTATVQKHKLTRMHSFIYMLFYLFVGSGSGTLILYLDLDPGKSSGSRSTALVGEVKKG